MADTAAPRTTTSRRPLPWAVISTVILAVTLIVLVANHQPESDPATEIGSLIRCPVCQGVPIADSPAPMARDMMALLRDRLEAGATRQEAIEDLLGAYPGSLLLEPRLSGATLALWLLPAAAIVVGGGLALTVRRSRRGIDTPTERSELVRRRDDVNADLADLAGQEAAGEIDPTAARHLKEAYLAELAETEQALGQAPASDAPLPRSRRRVMAGAVAVVASLALVVALAGAFLVDRPGSASGVAGTLAADPSEYSNETLAAVIASNADHPQIDGMRLALAERYFADGDYSAAFPYYLDVASSEAATPNQAATALTRLGWMTFDGNGEVDTALDLLTRARSLAPNDPFPIYLQGIVTWCGREDPVQAAALFQQVLGYELGGLADEVGRDLAAAEAGEPCRR